MRTSSALVLVGLLSSSFAFAQAPPAGPSVPAVAPPRGVTIATVTAPPTVAVPLASCPTPTLQTCQSAGYLATYCGRVHHGPLCKTLIQAAIPAEVAKLPVTPGQSSFIGNRRVKTEATSYADFTFEGGETLAIGPFSRTQFAAAKPRAQMTPGETAMVLIKGLWHANGNEVASCSEYAHEKYWTFSLFEDAAAASFDDARGVFTRATTDLAGRLVSKDGQTTFTVEWPTDAPKNKFYLGIPSQGLGYPAGAKVFAYNPAILAFVDRAGYRYHRVQDLNWHKTAAAALANLPDATLDELYAKQLAFEDLLEQRGIAIFRHASVRQSIDQSNVSAATKASRIAADNQALATELYGIDTLLQNAITQAKIDGCLDLNSAKCDWSPRMFVDTVETRLLGLKQDAYKACRRLTLGDFGATSQIKNANGITPACTDCSNSSTNVDRFITAYQAVLDRLGTGGVKINPKTRKPIIGSSSNDTEKKGNSSFNVGYRYTGGWEATDFLGKADRLCNANVRSYSTFGSFVTVFGHKEDVLVADVELASKPAALNTSATVRVLGNDLITPISQSGTGSPAFNIAEVPQIEKRVGYAQYFVLIAVPIKVEAGFAGAVGLEVALGGRFMRSCANANGTLDVKGEAKVKPWGKLEAYASASVDLAVAEAGVRASLTLLKVSLPLNSTLELRPGPSNRLSLMANSQLDLETRTLDGNVVVFIEFAGDEARKKIVSWRGPRSRNTLFDFNQTTVPLEIAKNGL